MIHSNDYMTWSLFTGKRLLLVVVGVTLILLHCTSTHGAGTGSVSLAKPGCQDRCGDVVIPYPFGIGQSCFLQEDFEVICENEQPSISMVLLTTSETFHLKVLNLSLLDGEARIQNSIQNTIKSSCNYTNGTVTGSPTDVLASTRNSFLVSSTKNKFTALGCATVASIIGSTDGNPDSNNWHYTTACASFCDSVPGISKSVECDGMGCCQTSLPRNLSGFWLWFYKDDRLLHNPWAQSFSPCSYAFIVEDISFKFNASYAQSSNFESQDWLPLVLDWSIGNESCDEAKKNLSSYACKGTNSTCIPANNGPGYLCNCTQGYEGNPYLDGGCLDINECDSPSLYPCKGTCTNTVGSYRCLCPPGTQSDDLTVTPCTPFSSLNQLQVKVIIGTSVSFISIIICISTLLIYREKRNLAKEKERFFKQNGGPILYQQILSRQIDTVVIFNIEDLNKATNNFDISRELGTGGQSTVYKGILDDNKVVAVKRSKTMHVTQTEEFVQEIIILSQINHRNVVRLLGCCLEVEVPILVYEYIPNGTLFQLLHSNHSRLPVSLEDRLRIAQESAEALEYLHVSINHPIVHGDVKSLNILLDDKYMTKVSDFGASKMLPSDAIQLMTMVQGTLGYLDPEYLKEQKLTEKSDVYSFGVVLLELITSKTAIYFEGSKEGKNLASSFQKAMEEKRAESMIDASLMAVGMEELFEEVAELASLCLRFKGVERPSMTQVADKLKAIRSTWREVLLRKHEEMQRLQLERLDMPSSSNNSLSPDMHWTARMMGLDIETPQEGRTGTFFTN